MTVLPDKFLKDWNRPQSRLLDWICCDEGHGMVIIEAGGNRCGIPGIPDTLLCYCEVCDRYRRVVADSFGENFKMMSRDNSDEVVW